MLDVSILAAPGDCTGTNSEILAEDEPTVTRAGVTDSGVRVKSLGLVD